MFRLTCLVLGFITFAMSVQADEHEWKTIFDGKSFDGWKASENKDSWSIEDGALVAHGPRSHLFYVGEDRPFKNFELQCDVKTTPGGNGGIYIHTRYQEVGWPYFGHEVQVNITQKDPIKSGSLYQSVNISDPPAKDNEYYTQYIKVDGNHVVSKINGQTLVDYHEPPDKPAHADYFESRLGEGTFALQAHDPDSRIYYKNIKVRRLP